MGRKESRRNGRMSTDQNIRLGEYMYLAHGEAGERQISYVSGEARSDWHEKWVTILEETVSATEAGTG